MTTHTQTTADPKVESVQRLYAAVGTNDIDAILDELADDVDWAAEAASTSVPWYGNYHGKAEVPRFFEALSSNIEITDFARLAFTSNETEVIVRVRFAYTVNATGKSAAMVMQHRWCFDGGKIVHFRGAEDTEQSVAAFTPTDPKIDTIRRDYEAFGRGDLDAVLAELTDDVDWAAEAASTSAPWYGTYHGKGEVPRFFKELGTNVEITEFTPLSIASNDTDVMVAILWTFTARETGTTVTQNIHHWWRFEGAKIAFYRGSDDSELTATAFA